MPTLEDRINQFKSQAADRELRVDKVKDDLKDAREFLDNYYNQKILDLGLDPNFATTNEQKYDYIMEHLVEYDLDHAQDIKDAEIKAQQDYDNAYKDYQDKLKEYNEKRKQNPKQRAGKPPQAPDRSSFFQNVPKPQEKVFVKEINDKKEEQENKNQIIKKQADLALKNKSALIDNIKKSIEDVKQEISQADEKKEILKNEIDALTNQLDDIKLEQQQRQDELQRIIDEKDELLTQKSDLEQQLQEAKDRLNKIDTEIQVAVQNGDTDKIDELEKERDNINNTNIPLIEANIKVIIDAELPTLDDQEKVVNSKLADGSDKISDLESQKSQKQVDLNAIENTDYEQGIKDLEDLAQSLELGLKDNIKDFIEGFDQIGINYVEGYEQGQDTPTPTGSSDTTTTENKEDKTQEKDSKTQGASGVAAPAGNVVEPQGASNMPVVNSRIKSNHIVDRFLDASPEEQKLMLDNYGFEDLKANMLELGPFKRRKLINAMENHYQNSFPEYDNFEDAINLISGVSGVDRNSLYSSFFDKKGNLVNFSKMDVKALQEIQNIINKFNENRKNFSPDEIQFFDKNFMQFVKNGAMLQSARQGRIQSFLSNFSKKNPVYYGIINSVGTYTRQNAKAMEKAEEKNNNIRKVRDRLNLKNQVVEDPQYTSHDTKLDPSRHMDDRTM